MADKAPIFDTVRPWLDSAGFNEGRVPALNAACDNLRVGDHSAVFNAVRGWLDGRGFTPGRIADLDSACVRYLAAAQSTAGSIEAGASAGMEAGGIAGALAQPAATGDDRYLRLFEHLASPSANPETVKGMARAFAAAAPRYGQDGSKARTAEFVAQIANETGGFLKFEEDLRYRAATMVRQWPTHFTQAQAAAAVGNPVEIASRAYGGRMGNAAYPSQDGYTFRGRGALQLTGRTNYRRFGQLTGLPLEAQPDMAADPNGSVIVALEYFKQGGVNAAIDRGDFRQARKLTNGGYIGVDEVARLRAKALQVL